MTGSQLWHDGQASSIVAEPAVDFTASAARRAFDLLSKLSPLLAIFSPLFATRRHRYFPAVSA